MIFGDGTAMAPRPFHLELGKLELENALFDRDLEHPASRVVLRNDFVSVLAVPLESEAIGPSVIRLAYLIFALDGPGLRSPLIAFYDDSSPISTVVGNEGPSIPAFPSRDLV